MSLLKRGGEKRINISLLRRQCIERPKEEENHIGRAECHCQQALVIIRKGNMGGVPVKRGKICQRGEAGIITARMGKSGGEKGTIILKIGEWDKSKRLAAVKKDQGRISQHTVLENVRRMMTADKKEKKKRNDERQHCHQK